MSFRERTAWGMIISMVITGLIFTGLSLHIPLDSPPSTLLLSLIPYVIAVIVLSIIVAVVLAAISPKQANQPADERERLAIDRAGHWSSYVLSSGVVLTALSYLWHGNGHVLFMLLIGALILAQIAEYGLQLVFFRRGV